MTSVGIEQDYSGEIVAGRRRLVGAAAAIIYWGGVLISLFHLWVNTVGVMPELQRNALHYGSLLFMGYLLYPFSKKRPYAFFRIDVALAFLSLAAALYLLFFENALHARNEVTTNIDLVFAALAIVLLLEITRRTSGFIIPLLATLFLAYALFLGRAFGGLWYFPGVTFERVLYRMYFAPDGIFGSIATISSTFVFLFVLFAAFLLKSGAGEFIIKLALTAMGRTVGGPAKMAVLASGLMGSISGSAVANTVGTGSLTIPLMKRSGFTPRFAAAVEAASSTGGQLMPPVMGAGAFIMSSWTQIPYLKIVAASFIPAILYFLTVAFFIHLRARKRNLQIAKNEDAPRLFEVLKEGWNFIIPIAVLMGFLFYGFTPTFAACAGIGAVVASSWLNRSTRMSLKEVLDALSLGAQNMVTTAIILLCAGIIVGVVLLVGMGIKCSMLISAVAAGNMLLAIALIALASLVLGMGLPVTASYIVLAVLAAPALTMLGASLLSAHMLIFWYSQDANVTPPVCLAAYSAAGIAGSNPLRTGLESWKLAKGLYIIPLLFAYTPLLLEGSPWIVLETALAALLGLFCFAVFFEGFFIRQFGFGWRILFAAVAFFMLYPNLKLHAGGLAFFVLLWFAQRRLYKRAALEEEAVLH